MVMLNQCVHSSELKDQSKALLEVVEYLGNTTTVTKQKENLPKYAYV